ncbi:MAG: hypothetical protein ACE5JP_17595 [Candidatus Bipolaricaulia bacterium]
MSTPESLNSRDDHENDGQERVRRPRKGLTFGRMITIIVSLTLIAVVVGYIQQLASDKPRFDEVGFGALQDASYEVTEIDRPQLEEFGKAAQRVQGTLVFVKTSEGRFAKLDVAFSHRFFSNEVEFVIYKGVIYNPDGSIERELPTDFVSPSFTYDLDRGRSSQEGATEEEVDLAFLYRGVADQRMLARNGASFSVPTTEALKQPQL